MAKKKNLTKAEQKKARLRQRRMEREAKERTAVRGKSEALSHADVKTDSSRKKRS